MEFLGGHQRGESFGRGVRGWLSVAGLDGCRFCFFLLLCQQGASAVEEVVKVEDSWEGCTDFHEEVIGEVRGLEPLSAGKTSALHLQFVSKQFFDAIP